MTMMTYEAAAEILGISAESVRRTARKKRWKRAIGNDGRGLVELPQELLAAKATERADPGADVPDGPRALIEKLEKELAAAIARAEVSETKAEILERLLDAERRRADSEARRAESEASRAQAEAGRADSEARRAEEWKDLAMKPIWRRIFGRRAA